MCLLWGVLVAVTGMVAQAQVVWTPIFFEASGDDNIKGVHNSCERGYALVGRDQVDMWTAKTEGCRCSYDLTRQECACCVKDGGCQCGLQSPNRCGQCGIHQYCNKMCNITLNSRTLMEKSGKRYGQIKSPSLEGPTFCWYRLLPDSGQRVEIQLYRLVSVGRFNGTGCEGGFVQLVAGLDSVPRPRDAQVCGANERFAPPVIMFEDRGAATLIFQIAEKTERSQFLAYFSFTPRNSSRHQAALNFQPSGGRRIEGTECDWMYQESWCRESSGPCKLSSPGYPGIYGPHKRCKYHITAASPHTRVRIKFTSLSLPPSNHCTTHFIKVYHGSSSSSPLLETLCGNKKKDIIHTGPNILIVFGSGPLISPFHHNGFVALLEFYERQTTTQPPLRTTARTTETAILSDDKPATWNSSQPPCELFYWSNQTRHGLFDSRGLIQRGQKNCTLVFIGGPTELVFVSLANYDLRSSMCQSKVELYDGYRSATKFNLMKRVCSPISKRTRDSAGRLKDRENYISKSNVLQLDFKRHFMSQSMDTMEYVQGAFLFHDELIQGTPTPSSLCDVEYRGNTSNTQGTLTNPGETEIYWTVDGSLECTQRLQPLSNQSVSINIVSLRRLAADTHCHTECGDGGCKCVTNLLPLDHMDHLLILNDTGHPLCCICGPFQEEWLPVGVRSWSPLRLMYYVARYNWATKGFEYETDYQFYEDHVCGHRVLTQHSGEVESVNMTVQSQLNYFLHQSCTWKLDSNVERQLTISMSSPQRRPCSAWNLSIHEYNEQEVEHAGKRYHSYCSKDGNKTYTLPYKLNIVIIRLLAITNKPPQFSFRWKSQVVRANTRTSGYIPMITSDTEPSRPVTMATALTYLTLLILTSS